MIVVDSDIFVIDRRYPNDPRYQDNRRLVERIKGREIMAATTLVNVLEVCGILSFNLNRGQLIALYRNFASLYGLRILGPPDSRRIGTRALSELFGKTFQVISRQMAFQDALILQIAESHSEVDTFVTWNARHFVDKTHLKVLLPTEL